MPVGPASLKVDNQCAAIKGRDRVHSFVLSLTFTIRLNVLKGTLTLVTFSHTSQNLLSFVHSQAKRKKFVRSLVASYNAVNYLEVVSAGDRYVGLLARKPRSPALLHSCP